MNREIDANLAEEFTKSFLECIIAPSYSNQALEILSKRKNLRLLMPNAEALHYALDLRSYGQGLLFQEIQAAEDDESQWKIVTESQPDPSLMPVSYTPLTLPTNYSV